MMTQDEIATEPSLERLDPRWIRYARIRGMLRTLIWTVLLGAAAFLLGSTGLSSAWLIVVPVALVSVLVAAAWVWPGVAYRYASYRLGGRALEVRRGVLWRRVADVPRSRMQHSDVSQGPLERLHGLATLAVYTAGMRYALVKVEGLSHERAIEIREHLTRTDGDDVI